MLCVNSHCRLVTLEQDTVGSTGSGKKVTKVEWSDEK
jgi:hypothetical protein